MRRLFIEEAGGSEEHLRREHKRLDALIAFCEAPECRRRTLLAYFDESLEAPCGNCDVCLHPPELADGTQAARQALSAVAHSGQRFGAVHVIDILRGADTERIRSLGHGRLPSYGSGSDIGKAEWRTIFRQLIAAGYLRLDVAGHGGMSLTQKGLDLSNGEGEFRYRRDTATGKARTKTGRKSSGKTVVGDLSDSAPPSEVSPPTSSSPTGRSRTWPENSPAARPTSPPSTASVRPSFATSRGRFSPASPSTWW
jgi:ATP-dependent DNA helicase RecQ